MNEKLVMHKIQKKHRSDHYSPFDKPKAIWSVLWHFLFEIREICFVCKSVLYWSIFHIICDLIIVNKHFYFVYQLDGWFSTLRFEICLVNLTVEFKFPMRLSINLFTNLLISNGLILTIKLSNFRNKKLSVLNLNIFQK